MLRLVPIYRNELNILFLKTTLGYFCLVQQKTSQLILSDPSTDGAEGKS